MDADRGMAKAEGVSITQFPATVIVSRVGEPKALTHLRARIAQADPVQARAVLALVSGRTPTGGDERLDRHAEISIGIDMCSTCVHRFPMNAMIQIRNVPEPLHRELKSRAALAGMSLSEYLLNEIRQVAERPTLDQLRARLDRRPPASLSLAPAEAVRAERDRY